MPALLRTTDQILADFRFWSDVDSGTLTALELDGCDPDGFVHNNVENLVEEAIRAGLIEADWENNGWHEGWMRMLKQLDRLADAAASGGEG